MSAIDPARIRARHGARLLVADAVALPDRPNLTTGGRAIARCERCNASSACGRATCDTVLVLDALEQSEAAIARVRALLDELDGYVDSATRELVDDLRAALDVEQQRPSE